MLPLRPTGKDPVNDLNGDHSDCYNMHTVYCIRFETNRVYQPGISNFMISYLQIYVIYTCYDTVDGRNPANQLRLVVSPIKQGFIHPTWLFGISSINSIEGIPAVVNSSSLGCLQ